MNTVTALDPLAIDPLDSGFETEEQETGYNAWLIAKLTRSMADPRPRIAHDEVMAEMDALIDQIEAEKAAKKAA